MELNYELRCNATVLDLVRWRSEPLAEIVHHPQEARFQALRFTSHPALKIRGGTESQLEQQDLKAVSAAPIPCVTGSSETFDSINRNLTAPSIDRHARFV
jgi:hypothetical protein